MLNKILILVIVALVSSSNIRMRHDHPNNHHLENNEKRPYVPGLWGNGFLEKSSHTSTIQHNNKKHHNSDSTKNNEKDFDIYDDLIDDIDEDDPPPPSHPVQNGNNNYKNCKTCQNGVKMTEEELTELRIAYVKNQILKKLKLSKRPQVTIKDLPRPITEKFVPYSEDESMNRQNEDYYARTTKKFIFLQEGKYLIF